MKAPGRRGTSAIEELSHEIPPTYRRPRARGAGLFARLRPIEWTAGAVHRQRRLVAPGIRHRTAGGRNQDQPLVAERRAGAARRRAAGEGTGRAAEAAAEEQAARDRKSTSLNSSHEGKTRMPF